MESGVRRLAKAIIPARWRGPIRALRVLWAELRVREIMLADRVYALVRRRPRPHGLPGPLILSLTSHGPRFASLHRTLACLLRQTVKPDRLVLWLAERDRDLVPKKVLSLTRRGLEIRFGDDLRSYKKLVPALAAFPDAFIVTADDDVYYPPEWLETFIAAFDRAAPAILCVRAHRFTLADGAIAPYRAWQRDVQDDCARDHSADLIPTGVGGVFYPPGALHADTADADQFMRLCPEADDFWFYWMARRAGTSFRKVGPRFRYRPWPRSEIAALHTRNLNEGYDRQIRALVEAFGLPAGCG